MQTVLSLEEKARLLEEKWKGKDLDQLDTAIFFWEEIYSIQKYLKETGYEGITFGLLVSTVIKVLPGIVRLKESPGLKRVDPEVRLEHCRDAVRWMEYRKGEWTPDESNKPVRLDGSSFTNPVIEVLPAKRRSDRNYGT